MSQKVYGVGLDGATYDLLLPWFEEGRLPNLKRFYDNSAQGLLASTIPYMSAPAWASFYTGQNPGKHGIYDFVEHRKNSYDIRFCNGATVRTPSLWRILSRAGKKVGVINVPMTYPPEEVNGFLLSGMEAPGVHSQFAHPPDLYEKLKKEIGEYNMHGDYYTTAGPEVFINNIFATIDNQVEAALYLIKEYKPDFFFFVIGSTDRVQHFFWKYIDPSHPLHDPEEAKKYGSAILRVYEHCDKALEKLFAAFPDDALRFIMSDHGAGPYHKIVHMDKWLAEQGYLTMKNEEGAQNFLKDQAINLYIQMRKYFPRTVKDFLKSNFGAFRQKLESNLLVSHIDWKQTKAFSMGVETTNIFINSSDRFPEGVVAPGAEYEKIRSEITESLFKLTDPETGEKIVAAVHRREELFSGPAFANAPDLIVLWKDDKYITRRSYGRSQAKTTDIIDKNLRFGEIGDLMALEQTGTHKRHGILMLNGPGTFAPGTLEGASIMDVTPTILHAMGMLVPEDMDGRVLTEAFEQDFLKKHPVQYITPSNDGDHSSRHGSASLNKEEKEALHERLKNLGYVE